MCARQGPRRRLTALVFVVVSLLTCSRRFGCAAPSFTGLSTVHSRKVLLARPALDVEGAASFTFFSVAAGAPIPILFSAAFRRAEAIEAQNAARVQPAAQFPFQLNLPFQASTQQLNDAPNIEDVAPEPRDLMWAFPSFAVFLEDPDTAAPSQFPQWARWLCVLTFWPGLIWYLWYKLLVEEDLRRTRNLGIGGFVVIVPFTLGLLFGVFGEVAYGSLEGDALANPYSIAFYAAFAWIYLNQWFLYNKVNQLFEEEQRPAPLDPYGLFVPGWNFVTGIRQIHFLAEYWARQRGQELEKDAFADLFPFARQPTLTLPELATTPSLWIDLRKLTG